MPLLHNRGCVPEKSIRGISLDILSRSKGLMLWEVRLHASDGFRRCGCWLRDRYFVTEVSEGYESFTLLKCRQMLHKTVSLCVGKVGRSVLVVQLGKLRSVERYYLRKMGKIYGSDSITAKAFYERGHPTHVDSPTPEARPPSSAEGSGQRSFSGMSNEISSANARYLYTPRMPIVSPLLSHLYHSGSPAELGPGLQSLGNYGVVTWLWREPQAYLHVSGTQTRRIELGRGSI